MNSQPIGLLYILIFIRPISLESETMVNRTFITTPACTIPRKSSHSSEAVNHLGYYTSVNCTDKPRLVLSNDNSIWIDHSARKSRNLPSNLDCCYSEVWRPNPVEFSESNRMDISVGVSNNCTQFVNHSKINFEYVEVRCHVDGKLIYKDYHAFVPKNLGQKRRLQYEKPSVIIIGIDSVSRGSFRRNLPKTIRFLRLLGAFSFKGLSKVGDNSLPNAIAMLTGQNLEEFKKSCWARNDVYFDNCVFLWNHFKNNGYITAFVEEASYIGLFSHLKQGFKNQPTDIYGQPFIMMNEQELGIGRDTNNVRACAGTQTTLQMLLNYTQKIISTLTKANQPFWGYFWSTTLTHDFFTVPLNVDTIYKSLFKFLKSSGALKNSVVLFTSTHGLRFGDFRRTYQGYLEERQPFAYFIIPKWIANQFPQAIKNMKNNENRLTTVYDLGATLMNVLNIKNIGQQYEVRRGTSLFSAISETRTCKSAHIPEHYCVCQKDEEINKSSMKKIYNAGRFIVRHINKMLQKQNVKTKCRILALKQVLYARKKVRSNIKPQTNIIVIGLSTQPGEAEFEATIHTKSDFTNITVLGDISRINRFSKASCIEDKNLRLYCICKKQNK